MLSNVKIYFANNKVSFLDQNLDIILTSIGHYAVPISRTKHLLDNLDRTVDLEKVFLTINEKTKSSDEKAKKLDCQFGHSSSKKLKELSAVC